MDLAVVPDEKFIVNRTRVISCLSSLSLQYKCILLRDKEERNCKRFSLLSAAAKGECADDERGLFKVLREKLSGELFERDLCFRSIAKCFHLKNVCPNLKFFSWGVGK